MKKNLGLFAISIICLTIMGCSSAPKENPSQVPNDLYQTPKENTSKTPDYSYQMPKENPSQILNDFFQNLKDNEIEEAYDLLSEASKKDFLKEDFIVWQNIQHETGILKEVKVEKLNEYTNKEIYGATYKNAIEFKLTETNYEFYEDNDITYTYTRYVVNDNGVWKICREKEDGKQKIAAASDYLGWMYIDGRGKSKDLSKAIAVLEKGLEYDPNYSQLYYSLSIVYLELGRNNEAMDSINIFLEKETDNIDKSNGYAILGDIYILKFDITNAKEAYSTAIELDPNNDYAKSSLADLE